jgi:hypothetical protein
VEYEPTLVDLSKQVGMLSTQMSAVLSAVSGNAQQTGYLASRIDGTNARMENLEGRLSGQLSSVHREVALLRTTQVTDHAPRILEVEQKTRSVVPTAKSAGKYGMVALAIPVLLQLASELKPNLAGPLQTLIQLFQ